MAPLGFRRQKTGPPASRPEQGSPAGPAHPEPHPTAGPLETLPIAISTEPLPRLADQDYHRFSVDGRQHLFVTSNWSILKLAPLFSRLFDLVEEKASDERIQSALAEGFGPMAAEKGIEEYRKLFEQGYLAPDRYLDQDGPGEFPRKAPITYLVLMVAGDCNMRCSYCFESKPDQRQRMSVEVAEAALSFLLRRSGTARDLGLAFFGGEPLLNLPVVRHVTRRTQEIEAEGKRRFQLTMTTNATLLDEETIDFLIDNQIGALISMDGPREVQDGHRRFRSGTSSFERVFERASRYIEKRKGSATIRATFTPGCLDLTSMARFFQAMGATGVFFSPATNVDHTGRDFRFDDAQKEALLQRYDEYVDFVGQEVKSGRLKRDHVIGFMDTLFSGQGRMRPCQVGVSNLTVAPDGSLYPCYRFIGMSGYRMGSVFGRSSRSIRRRFYRENHVLARPGYRMGSVLGRSSRSIRRRFYRENHVLASPACRNCWARYICGGECPGDTVANMGGIMQVEPFYCDTNLHLIDATLRLYVRLKGEGDLAHILGGKVSDCV